MNKAAEKMSAAAGNATTHIGGKNLHEHTASSGHSQVLAIDDIQLHIMETNDLVSLLMIKLLFAHRDLISNQAVRLATIGYREAYNLCNDYPYLSSCMHVIEDRLRDAAAMLDGVIRQRP